MEQNKTTQTLCVSYEPVCKPREQLLTHYMCTGGTRGYMTLRLRPSDTVREASERPAETDINYAPALT